MWISGPSKRSFRVEREQISQTRWNFLLAAWREAILERMLSRMYENNTDEFRCNGTRLCTKWKWFTWKHVYVKNELNWWELFILSWCQIKLTLKKMKNILTSREIKSRNSQGKFQYHDQLFSWSGRTENILMWFTVECWDSNDAIIRCLSKGTAYLISPPRY